MNNTSQQGAIKIIKQDTDTKQRLAGAKFRFRDTTNNYTATFTANGNGEVLIPGLSSIVFMKSPRFKRQLGMRWIVGSIGLTYEAKAQNVYVSVKQ